MKVLPFKIPKPENELVRHQIDDLPYFYDILHQHPEVQLTVIIKGTGNLVVGDYIGRFRPGEVYLIGSDIPHVFRNDSSYYREDPKKRAYSESIFYDLRIFSSCLSGIKEFHKSFEFFTGLNGCYKVLDEQQSVRSRILKLRNTSGIARIISSLEVLHQIMCPQRLIKLNIVGNLKNYSPRESKRMQKTLKFLMEHSHRPISLAEVAEVASMNKEAFCRFFKERTRKTMTQFLNEIRITNACHLLAEEEMTISHIAAETGFPNLSYFNRIFKKTHNCTPKEFRASLLADTRQV